MGAEGRTPKGLPHMPETTWARKRAEIAAKSRHHPDADLTDDRAELRALRLAEHVDRVVKELPPLTESQIEHIAAILRQAAS
jgi:hypothetical protein